jgi:hypothetical protein
MASTASAVPRRSDPAPLSEIFMIRLATIELLRIRVRLVTISNALAKIREC